MPALEIQKYLHSGKTTDDLKAELGIRAKSHPLYPNLFHFSYDQIESPSGHPIVSECRGLILDSNRDWKVVAFPFRRFANYGESWAADIDWKTARVTEKIDGSMIVLWFYAGRWNVSTKGSPDAGGQVGNYNFTFKDLFWETLESQLPSWHTRIKQYNEQDSLAESKGMLSSTNTYIFELTTPFNRIVCSYGAVPNLTLIGVRENYGNFQEIATSAFSEHLPVVQEYPIHSLEDALREVWNLDPIATEGYVVVDGDFNRIKIKSSKYVELHHLRTGGGIKSLLRLMRMGEVEEFLVYFPEYEPMVDDIRRKIDKYVNEVDESWQRLREIADKKEFALEALKTNHSSFLFSLHQKKLVDVRHRLMNELKPDGTHFISDDKLIEILDIQMLPMSLSQVVV